MKVKRLSSIHDGLHTALLIDGKVIYLKGYSNTIGAYVVIKRRKYYEKDLPIGEEVTI